MDMHSSIKYLQDINIDINEDIYINNQKETVVVGMSGGVDSSVAATIVKLMGYKTIGIFMKNWEEANGECTAELDYQDVESVAQQLDIPYYSLNFVEEYRENVFKNFLEEYELGFTPNPDILCNREIKFKVFYDKAMELGAKYLATGHYCQHLEQEQGDVLVKGADAGKDQTYFLYTMQSKILKNILFPIGHLQKNNVRKIANDFKLSTATKKDSTGICFIGERNFKEFLSSYITTQKGNFVHLESHQILGVHDGQCFYTMGQRKGLGLGGPGGPWFVAGKDVATNTVYVVEGESHPALYADFLTATDVSWVNTAPTLPYKCKAKIRYRQPDQECIISSFNNGTGQGLKVEFSQPQRAIAQRQSVVFYHEDVCIGGAIIEYAGPSYLDQKKSLATLP